MLERQFALFLVIGREKPKSTVRFDEDDILKVLKEVQAGGAIATLARAHGYEDQTTSCDVISRLQFSLACLALRCHYG